MSDGLTVNSTNLNTGGSSSSGSPLKKHSGKSHFQALADNSSWVKYYNRIKKGVPGVDQQGTGAGKI